jgi:hypothetical protein
MRMRTAHVSTYSTYNAVRNDSKYYVKFLSGVCKHDKK